MEGQESVVSAPSQGLLPHPSGLPIPALPQSPGERIFDLEETLDRYSQILQALQGLSKQLAQAERQWKKELGSTDCARPESTWVSGLCGNQRFAYRPGEAELPRHQWPPSV